MMRARGWRLICGKRSCGYLMDKRNNIEPYAAYNILLRPRLYDTTDLLLSMIHQDKFFKYKKKKRTCISFHYLFFCFIFLPSFSFLCSKRIHLQVLFLLQACRALDPISFEFLLREKKGYLKVFIGWLRHMVPHAMFKSILRCLYFGKLQKFRILKPIVFLKIVTSTSHHFSDMT